MWCIKNKLNNEHEALLLDTQQNDLIPTSYINVFKNRTISIINRFIHSSQFHIKPSDYSLKKIRLKPYLNAYKITTNYNYAQNMGMK